jgi:hypothetical protein
VARTRMRAVGACAGVLAVAALALAGCAPEPGPGPTASASSPAPSETPSPSASATPSPSPSPTPTPDGPPATRPVEPPTDTDPDAQGMAAEQAGELCAAEHRNGQGAGDTQVGAPEVYERTVEPHWYVTILAENEFGRYYQECILGGPVGDAEWSLTQGTPEAELTPAYIERQRTHNESFDDDDH